MTQALIQDIHEIADGIYCIETGLYRPGLAAAYLVRSGQQLALIDTGPAKAAPLLLAAIRALDLTPEQITYVMPTHVHLDHAGAAGHLMAECPNAQLIAHPKGAPHLIDPSKLIAGATAVYGAVYFERDFGAPLPIPAERVLIAEDGQTFDLNGRTLTFIDTPGHANHHGCIFDQQTHGVFSGDTFGIAYREFNTAHGPMLFAPTTPVAFEPDIWLASLDKLMTYAPQAMYLTHYGRLDQPAAQVAILRQSIRDLAELAIRAAHQPEAEWQQRIQNALRAYFIQRARAHGVELDEQHIYSLLSVDIELNAQGLAVWLKRRNQRELSA